MIYDYRELFFPKRLFLLLGDAGWLIIIAGGLASFFSFIKGVYGEQTMKCWMKKMKFLANNEGLNEEEE